MRKLIRSILRAGRSWLSEDEDQLTSSVPEVPIPFDNGYQWLGQSMRMLIKDPVCATRPHYAWGVLMGAALGKVLGYPRVSVLEFGVAGGAGLVAMERAAELAEQLIEIGIDVYGFDTGEGLPKPQDYRDVPFAWSEGYYPCDRQLLERRLRRARLKLGLLKNSVPAFLEESPSSVAFVGIDLCLYSSARDALRMFEADYSRLLPRVTCSFRCADGKNATDYTGERLSISEFNLDNKMRKVSPIYNLRYLVPRECVQVLPIWPEYVYAAHMFEHPLYGAPDSLQKSMVINVEGDDLFFKIDQPPQVPS